MQLLPQPWAVSLWCRKDEALCVRPLALHRQQPEKDKQNVHFAPSGKISAYAHAASISVRHGDAGDAVASPTLKNWPLFGQNFSKFEQSIQLHSHVSEVVSIFQIRQNSNQINYKIIAKTAK